MRVRSFVDAKINSRLLFTTAIWLDSSVRHCTNFLIDEIGGRSFPCKLDETRVREKSKRVQEFRLPCFTASQTSFYDPLVNRKTKNARNYGSFRSKDMKPTSSIEFDTAEEYARTYRALLLCFLRNQHRR